MKCQISRKTKKNITSLPTEFANSTVSVKKIVICEQQRSMSKRELFALKNNHLTQL